MKRISGLLPAPAAGAPLLSGCNSTANDTTTTTSTTPTLTGNWEFNTLYWPAPKTSFTWARSPVRAQPLTESSAPTPASPPTRTSISQVGSLDAKGNLTLTSTNLSATRLPSPPPGDLDRHPRLRAGHARHYRLDSLRAGHRSIYGNRFAPLTGTFTGTTSSTSSATVTATATLTQSTTANRRSVL